MSAGYIVLLVVVLLALFGGLPQLSGHSYGYWPSGAVGIILLILVILLLTGRL
jgi:hypothetical protein